MFAKLFLVAFFPAAFALHKSESSGNEIFQEKSSVEDTLRILTEEAGKKVSQTSTRISNAPEEYANITADRLESLMWECTVQKNALNKTIIDAVFKGMQKNKQLSNFQCISYKARETFEKLDAIEDRIPINTKEITQKGLARVTPLRFIMNGFSEYVQVLYKTKSEEVKKAGSDFARKKILKDVMQKMKLLETVLEKINQQATDTKFKFFEDYIHYAYATGDALKKIQRKGAELIAKCVA